MIVKCQKCGLKDTDRKDMEFDTVGEKKQKRYYHKGECWDTYLAEKKFKEEERVKKDALNEVLLSIYGVQQMPNNVWSILEDMRNGVPVLKGKQVNRRYKEGYDYLLIRDTFDYCSETIEQALRTKGFKGIMHSFHYALAVVLDKIYVVEQRNKQREKQKLQIERHMENVEADAQVFETNYKKPSKKNNVDITRFLD